MVQRTTEPSAATAKPTVPGARIVVIEAPYYAAIVEALAEGALAAIEEAGATAERLAVSGALELPQALAALVRSGQIGHAAGEGKRYDGAVILGCVIRGDTTHYDIVCTNANHWLMHTALEHGVPLGNAILTVENEQQAKARAANGSANKGAEAAWACLRLIEIERRLGS